MRTFTDLDSSPLRRTHWGLLALASMGLFLDGYDLSVITLAMLVIPRQLGLSQAQYLVVNVSSFAGMLVGAPLLGRLSDRYGRRTVFGLDLLLFVVFALAAAVAPGFGVLAAARFMLGIGIGGDYPLSATMVAELAPVKRRGMLLMGMVGMYWVGTLASGVANWLILPRPDFWRYTFAVGGIAALPVILLRLRIPESPRWLVSRGRFAEADRARRIVTGQAGPAAGGPAAAAPPRPLALRDAFGGRYALVTLFVLAAWFLFDVESYGIGFYIPLMFRELGLVNDLRLVALGGVLISVGAIIGYSIALPLVDRLGRRRLTITGFAVMFALLVLASAARIRGAPAVVAFVFAFVLFEQWIGAVTLFYPAELFPTSIRSSLQGIATAVSRVGAILGVLLFPLLPVFHSLAVFAAVAFVGLAVAIFLAPETRGASLEEIADRYGTNHRSGAA